MLLKMLKQPLSSEEKQAVTNAYFTGKKTKVETHHSTNQRRDNDQNNGANDDPWDSSPFKPIIF